MNSTKVIARSLLALSLVAQHLVWVNKAQAADVDRPPQFVIFAFDGSYTNKVWQDTRDFTQEQKLTGIDTRFTYFINPVYLVTRENRSVYKAPGGFRGSAIGWADSKEDILERVDHLNDAYLEGHEIANHAVGHHDGSKWTEAEWTSEFKQFNYIVDNLFSINGLNKTPKGDSSLKFNTRRDIVGFRAPLLGFSQGMWPALRKAGMTYDTSLKNEENYWPRKVNGIWNFPLGSIKEPGGARKWTSMDYNFCYRDSERIRKEVPSVMSYKAKDPMLNVVKGNTDRNCLRSIPPEQKAKVKANMMKLYRSYFNNNYYGNRAPVHIGHHFSQWMSGAYYESFFELAKEVCSKPEVRCVTYKELQDFMEGKTKAQIDGYQAGRFTKMTRPKSMDMTRHLDISMNVTKDDANLSLNLSGKDSSQKGLKKVMMVDGKTLEFTESVPLAKIRELAKDDDRVRFSLQNRLGVEIHSAVIEVNNLGTEDEYIGTENIEERAQGAHMESAHDDDAEHRDGHQ